MTTYPVFDTDNMEAIDRLAAQQQQYGGTGVYPRETEYGSTEAEQCGLVPLADYPDKIVSPGDFKDVIDYCHAHKIFPVYHQEPLEFLKTWNQDGLGYCWAYALTACVMGVRQAEWQQPVRLAPESLGWLVNWQNRGYYMDRAIQGAREKGIAPGEYVPQHVIQPSRFKPGWEQEALKYRVLEWWDCNCRLSESSIIGQALAILATGSPLYLGYMWWGHAVEGVGMQWNSGRVDWLIQNSHNDGVIVLSGRRSIPDEMYGPRATTIAK